MNKDTRKHLNLIMAEIEKTSILGNAIVSLVENINEKLSEFREAFEDAKSSLEEIRDEEQEKFYNLSEGLQASEKGQILEATVSSLDEAINELDTISQIEDFEFEIDIDSVISAIDNAKYAG